MSKLKFWLQKNKNLILLTFSLLTLIFVYQNCGSNITKLEPNSTLEKTNQNLIQTLSVSPSIANVAPNATVTFTATGGKAPYTFVISSGPGSINSTTGVFTAPQTAPATTYIKVIDQNGSITYATVNTVSQSSSSSSSSSISKPKITPKSVTLAPLSKQQFTAIQGIPPYQYSIVTGQGTINTNTGLYQAPAQAGTDIVQVIDSYGSTDQASITIQGSGTDTNPSTTYNPYTARLLAGGILYVYLFQNFGDLRSNYVYQVTYKNGAFTTAGLTTSGQYVVNTYTNSTLLSQNKILLWGACFYVTYSQNQTTNYTNITTCSNTNTAVGYAY
jgi:hypothetical protein